LQEFLVSQQMKERSMSDRNTTIITDRGGGMGVGIVVGVLAVLAVLVLVFGWHPWRTIQAKGPTITITAPTIAPAPAPAPAG
jgi:hypothetical protein